MESLSINSLAISNYQGIRKLSVDLNAAPVHLFCGHNGVGKSTVRDAIKFALRGEASRARLKKDYDSLISSGAKSGHVEVVMNDGEVIRRDVKTGKVTGNEPDYAETLALLLDADRFAAVSDDERRQYLAEAVGLQITADDIEQALKADNEDGEVMIRFEGVKAMLRSSVDAACQAAKDSARDAKAAWRSVTGETYGSSKAESWEPADVPDYDGETHNTLNARLREVSQSRDALQLELGAARGRLQDMPPPASPDDLLECDQDNIGLLSAAVEQAEDDVNTASERLTAAQDALDAAGKAGTSLSCPHCQTALRLESGSKLVKAEDANQVSKEEINRLQSARDAASMAMREARERFQSAEKALIKREAEQNAKYSDPTEYSAAQEAVAKLERQLLDIDGELVDLRSAVRDLENAANAVANAAKAEVQAARHHADVQHWTTLADALAPDGIPGLILAERLKPLNDRLREFASQTGWSQVTVDAEMQIRVGQRPYRLASESEQWRSNAMIAAAIADLSGCKVLILDRLDVLDIPGRQQAMQWLAFLADSGVQVLAMATLKAPPQAQGAITVHWMGESAQMRDAA